MEGDVVVPLGVGVDPVVFRAISCLDVTTILGCKDEMLRPILACLVSSTITSFTKYPTSPISSLIHWAKIMGEVIFS